MSEKRDIATRMAGNQKQASISEFFEKNKHFLGFDSLHRSLITAVKEAVDNALDACEEARILPDIKISIRKADPKRDVIELEVEDNGPGILATASPRCSDSCSSVRASTPSANPAVSRASASRVW